MRKHLLLSMVEAPRCGGICLASSSFDNSPAPKAFGAGESCHNNILVPPGTTEAPANKHSSVVPEGTLDFFVFEPSPAAAGLGYYQGKGTLNTYARRPYQTMLHLP